MANARAIPYTFANGPGNWPDANKWNANQVAVNDMFYVCTEAQLALLTPNTTTIYRVTDAADPATTMRIYTADGWYILPISKLVL